MSTSLSSSIGIISPRWKPTPTRVLGVTRLRLAKTLASVRRIALITREPPVVAITDDVVSITGDAIGEREVRAAPGRIEGVQILHPRRRRPAEGARLPAGVR